MRWDGNVDGLDRNRLLIKESDFEKNSESWIRAYFAFSLVVCAYCSTYVVWCSLVQKESM